jgi:hypothetical protein
MQRVTAQKHQNPACAGFNQTHVAQPPSAVLLDFVAQALLPVLLNSKNTANQRLQTKYEDKLARFQSAATKKSVTFCRQ